MQEMWSKMKTRLLIFTIALLLSMQLVYAQPVPEPEPVCKGETILINGACVSADGPMCGLGTTYQDGMCVVDKIENSTKLSSDKWGGYAYTDEQICGPGFELVDGVCLVIETERQEYGPIPPFVDALFFILIILPFFILSAIIFVVLSKTPRYSKEIRLTVCIPAIIMILYFLSGLYLGWYPLGFA